MSQETKNSTGWWEILKRAFFVIIFLQIVVSMIPNIKKQLSDMGSTKTKVSLINIRGGIISSNQWLKEIRHAIANKETKAILLRIDSGGGAPGSSEILMRELDRAKKHKPVIALIENICASGAYCIAVSADKIIAQTMSAVGSIGVITMMLKFKKILENNNIEPETIFAGKYKSMSNPFDEKLNPEMRKEWQTILNDTYASFKKLVMEHRPMLDPDQSEIWAEGRIFNGEKALEIGLIDQIGDLGDAENVIREAIDIYGTEIEYVYYPKKSPLVQMLSGRDDGDSDAPEGLPKSALALLTAIFTNSISETSQMPVSLS